MKLLKIICLLIVLGLLLSNISYSGAVSATSKDENKHLTVLFTHDLHDHLLPTKIEKDDEISETGGYARLKTAIDEERAKIENSILIDAGDYSMGTLFQSLFSSDAPELRILGKLGYDVTTLGNHEFDFRAGGLAKHLYAARNSTDKLPQLVSSNILFPGNDKMTKPLLDLKNAMKAYGVKEYTVLERYGIKIGIFGIIGKNAASLAPLAGVAFDDPVKSAQRMVEILKNKEKADIIICLSHSGTSNDSSKSEDEQLAKKVTGIDVIISGHSHTKLEKPKLVENTVIGACGEYSDYLGVMDLEKQDNGRWKLGEYTLKPIDSSLTTDEKVNETIDEYKSIVQTQYLDHFNFKFDEVLAQTPFSFIPTDKIGEKHQEDTLGNLISDGYIYSVKKAEGESYDPVAVSAVTAGTIRGSFIQGNITVQDVFSSSSLGIGPDGISGYPLISIYLTGKELKVLCEVDASIAPIMKDAQLYLSGITYTFNPNRLIFNKVTDIHLQREDGSLLDLNDTKLYRVITGLYNAQMLSIVGEKSFGLLSIRPKTKDGKLIKDFEKQIIYDKSGSNNNELKEWLSTAQYLKSFDKVDGVPRVPYYYNKLQNRKVIDNDKSISAILKSPNRIAIILYLIITAILAVIAFTVRYILKRKKRGLIKFT